MRAIATRKRQALVSRRLANELIRPHLEQRNTKTHRKFQMRSHDGGVRARRISRQWFQTGHRVPKKGMLKS